MTHKTLETYVRRMARRQVLAPHKSRRRGRLALDYGKWTAVDERGGRPGVDLRDADAVEACLATRPEDR